MYAVPKITSHIPLEGACNARDLGGYPALHGQTRKYAFIRCESPVNLTDADTVLLLKLGIRMVIDLRSREEIEEEPNPFARVPTISLHSIPVLGFNPTPGLMNAIDMRDLYIHMLDDCQEAFAKIFCTMICAGRGVLFHCTTGKDRTGVLAAILLLLASVPEDIVVTEYCYTQVLLKPWVERKCVNSGGRSLKNAAVTHASDPAYIKAAINRIIGYYDGAAGYLTHIGLTFEEINTLRRRILESRYQESSLGRDVPA